MNFIGFLSIKSADYQNSCTAREESVEFHQKKKKRWKHEWSQWKACEKVVLGLVRLYSCGYSSSNRFWCMISGRILKVGVKLIFGYSRGAPKMICLKYPLISLNWDTTRKNFNELGHPLHCTSGNQLWRYSRRTDISLLRHSTLCSLTASISTPVLTFGSQNIMSTIVINLKISEIRGWKWLEMETELNTTDN